jgi:pterin-4a-carbinolamine dehydratase
MVILSAYGDEYGNYLVSVETSDIASNVLRSRTRRRSFSERRRRMATKQMVQDLTPTPGLKAERVQEPLAVMRKRVSGRDDVCGSAMAVTRGQAEERLKAERVQLRLKQLPGWKMPAEGKAIDRVRKFADPLVAASYLAFAALLARRVGQPLRLSLVGSTIVIALTGRSKGAAKGINEEVLDLAEQLG